MNGKQVRITIPAGVANGQVIKLKGYGGEGINGGPAGDLYLSLIHIFVANAGKEGAVVVQKVREGKADFG